MPTPWPKTPPTAEELAAFADARRGSFWLDDVDELELRPEEQAPLAGSERCDLAIVGGGFTGLWAAIHAKTDDPSRDVVVLDRERCGAAASGRNGGFLEASLTHGVANGLSRFPEEMATLERLGDENYAGLLADIERLGIDCDLEEPGALTLLLEPHQEAWIDEELAALTQFGHRAEAIRGAEATRALVNTPLARAAVWQRSGAALVHPGTLAAGLLRAALELGVRVHERTAVVGIDDDRGTSVSLRTAGGGRLVAQRALLATNASRSLIASTRRRIVPVYDYVLMSEPLDALQRASIGWAGRQGVSDATNQFHYLRLTADDRILIGGYDAVYRYGSPVGAHLDDAPDVFGRLSQHLFTLFPQLRGLRFTHRWGGAIDTCSRFSVFFDASHDGRVVSATGYTGLGVGATRWGARTALDLVDGRDTEATNLRFVRERPTPFPPEPLRWAAIALTRNRLAAADEREGRRGLWLSTLDRLGLGFDS